MNRKLVGALAVAGVAVLVMTGCASSAPKADSGPVTITYTNFISDGANVPNLTKIVNAFEKANPKITVNVKTIPYSGYATAQQTDLAAGTASDASTIGLLLISMNRVCLETSSSASSDPAALSPSLTGTDTSITALAG